MPWDSGSMKPFVSVFGAAGLAAPTPAACAALILAMTCKSAGTRRVITKALWDNFFLPVHPSTTLFLAHFFLSVFI